MVKGQSVVLTSKRKCRKESSRVQIQTPEHEGGDCAARESY